MPRSLLKSALILVVAVGAASIGSAARADEYPSKPIRVIVPVAPGGLADIFSRTFAQKVSDAGKARVVVENRPGGGGVIAADAVAKSAPDGYTLLTATHSVLAILPHLVPGITYDAPKDFTPVIQVFAVPNILVVHPSVPANSVAELIALIKAAPGKYSYASQGPGSTGHIAGELFRMLAGIDIVHVPYKGAGPAQQDLIGGHVPMLFDIVNLAAPQVRAGRLRALGVTSAERVSVLPEVPTMAQAGVAGIEGGAWFGLVAPSGTPPAVIAWLNREATAVFSEPELRERFTSQGAQVVLGSSETYGKYIASEYKRWGEVIRRAGIKLE